MSARTKVLIIHPVDLTHPKVGGIHSFLDAFVAFAPPDFEIEQVGITVGDRPTGSWTDEATGGRSFRFLPLLASEDAERRSMVPLGARFALALLRARRSLSTRGRVLQFHRPGLALPYLSSGRGRIQVIHLSGEQLTSSGSESRWRMLGGALRRVEDRVLPRMTDVFAISEDVADRYRASYPALADRIHFLSNWYDERYFAPPTEAERADARAALRQEIGAGLEDRVILAAGRLERQKDPLLAVETMALADPAVRLAWIGDGSLRGDVLAHIGRKGLGDRVLLLPPRARMDLARAMAGADAFLVTSAHETGPTVAFEALATGLPLVATDVGRVRALVEGTEAGSVVTRATAEELAAAIEVTLAGDAKARRREAAACVAGLSARSVLEPFYEAHHRASVRA